MAMLGYETVLGQMKAKLQADMPAKVEALNTAFGDAYVLAVPANASYVVAIDKLKAASMAYPVIVLSALDADAGERSLGDRYMMSYPVQVDVAVQHSDPEQRMYQCFRYVRAVAEILGGEATLACGGCRYEGSNFAAPEISVERDIVRDVPSLFTVTTEEATA